MKEELQQHAELVQVLSIIITLLHYKIDLFTVKSATATVKTSCCIMKNFIPRAFIIPGIVSDFLSVLSFFDAVGQQPAARLFQRFLICVQETAGAKRTNCRQCLDIQQRHHFYSPSGICTRAVLLLH